MALGAVSWTDALLKSQLKRCYAWLVAKTSMHATTCGRAVFCCVLAEKVFQVSLQLLTRIYHGYLRPHCEA